MAPLHFRDRTEFRDWLGKNAARSGGVWLLFGKKGGPGTLKADEAVEEALCCGWIDGQLKRLDGRSYVKYFSPRRRNSPWSLRNRTTAERLEKEGRMADAGRLSVEQAKRNGVVGGGCAVQSQFRPSGESGRVYRAVAGGRSGFLALHADAPFGPADLRGFLFRCEIRGLAPAPFRKDCREAA